MEQKLPENNGSQGEATSEKGSEMDSSTDCSIENTTASVQEFI